MPTLWQDSIDGCRFSDVRLDLELTVAGVTGSQITVLEKNDGAAGGRRYRHLGRIRPPGGQMIQWLVRQIDDGSPNPRLSEGWLWLESLRRAKHYADFFTLLSFPIPYGTFTLFDLIEPDLDEWEISDPGDEQPIGGIAARRLTANHRRPADELDPYVPSLQEMWFSTSPTAGAVPVPILAKQTRAQGSREIRFSDWRLVGGSWLPFERRIIEHLLIDVESIVRVVSADPSPLDSDDLDRSRLGTLW